MLTSDTINAYSVYPLIALLGYVIGSFSMAYFLARLRGVDLRESGSGNLGASNTLVLMGCQVDRVAWMQDNISRIASDVVRTSTNRIGEALPCRTIRAVVVLFARKEN